MQFKTKLICYYVPAHASGAYEEAEKLWALPDLWGTSSELHIQYVEIRFN